jgi:hypothetical protein
MAPNPLPADFGRFCGWRLAITPALLLRLRPPCIFGAEDDVGIVVEQDDRDFPAILAVVFRLLLVDLPGNFGVRTGAPLTLSLEDKVIEPLRVVAASIWR